MFCLIINSASLCVFVWKCSFKLNIYELNLIKSFQWIRVVWEQLVWSKTVERAQTSEQWQHLLHFTVQVNKSNYEWKYAFAEQIHWFVFKSQDVLSSHNSSQPYNEIRVLQVLRILNWPDLVLPQHRVDPLQWLFVASCGPLQVVLSFLKEVEALLCSADDVGSGFRTV